MQVKGKTKEKYVSNGENSSGRWDPQRARCSRETRTLNDYGNLTHLSSTLHYAGNSAGHAIATEQ